MLKTTPLVVTIGLSLTIPLAVLGDSLLGRSTRGLVLVGALLVIASFLVVGLDDAAAQSKEEDDPLVEEPKEGRRRSGRHEPSVKLAKRQFAVQDNAVEHVEIGDAIEASGEDILKNLSATEVRPVLKKKDKIQAKHESFMERLETSTSPYSKSHARRIKRKAKEQIASGLGEMQEALAALEDDIPLAVRRSVQITTDVVQESQSAKVYVKPGMIGEGKKAPLTKAQRKRALQMEQVRHPLILANPDFAANPFQTIRTHAQNTLIKREISSK
ncbi:hypothetical protein H0H81_003806 [Sphagnurus paluster]|uniref:Ribosome biogenesis protein SLX9 n=1 Tax=Sphagnurus paluster TaxID=117069 RepID=A0A9P7GUP7_9AGAR|nr:hypothetical protein H0H81_003806 [Sphagnurus paluster]